MSTSISFGRPALQEFGMPQISNYTVGFRAAMITDDASPAAAEAAGSVIDLTNSRYGTGNVIYVDVIAGSAGCVVTIYKKIGTDYIYVDSQTTTKAKQELRFYDLLGGNSSQIKGVAGDGKYILVFTSVPNPTTINAGGTN